MSTCSALSAAYNNASVRCESSPVDGLSTIWRSALPTSVSPGSKVSRTVWPAASSVSLSRRDWVDLPAPSPPSKQTNSPRSAYTLWLTRTPYGRAPTTKTLGAVRFIHARRPGGNMAITEHAPTDLAVIIDRSIRRIRIAAWTLALAWLCLLVALVAFASRESTYAELEHGIRSRRDHPRCWRAAMIRRRRRRATRPVDVRWRDGLILRTATLTLATDERMPPRGAPEQSRADPSSSARWTSHLSGLDPDVRIQPRRARAIRHPRSYGWTRIRLVRADLPRAPGRDARTHRRTSTVAGDALGVGLAGPARAGRRRARLFPLRRFHRPVPARPPARIWLTGGWAFILALLLGGAASS